MDRANILIVDDEKDICDLVRDILEDEGYNVAVAYNGEEARAEKKRHKPDLILLDIWMPDIDGISLLQEWRGEKNFCPVIMMSGHGTLEHAIEATKLGASDFLEKPLTLAKLLMVVEKTLAEKNETPLIINERTIESNRPTPFEPIGRSPLMSNLRNALNNAAKAEWSDILFLTERGSEISGIVSFLATLANAHSEVYIEVSLIDLNASELQSLLKGSDHSLGLIDQYQSAWISFTEIDRISLEAQEILYQFLTHRDHYSHHQKKIVSTDFRFIYTAHNSIQKLVNSRSFSEDLWHCIHEITIEIPPLSAHPEDVPDLISYYVHHFAEEEHLTYRHFSIAAQNRLRNHVWIGNHLELKNLIKRLLTLGKHDEVSLDEINAELERAYKTQNHEMGGNSIPLDLPLREAREQFERTYLIAQYQEAEGNIANLADRVGMERTNLYRKLKSLDIDPKTGS